MLYFPYSISTTANSARKSIEELEQKVVAGTLFFPSKKSSKYQREFPQPTQWCPRPLSFSIFSQALMPVPRCGKCSDRVASLKRHLKTCSPDAPVSQLNPKASNVNVWASWPQAGPILKAQKHFVSPKLDRTLFGALSSNVVARKATCDLVRVVIVPTGVMKWSPHLKPRSLLTVRTPYSGTADYTQTLLHTDAFTHRRFCTQSFTHRRFYTQKLLHTEAFTHKHFYTNTFTHKHFYTQRLLHTDAFTHRQVRHK